MQVCRKELLEVLKKAKKIVNGRTMPILNSVMIKDEAIWATDLDVYFKHTVDCEDSIDCLADCKLLFDIVSKLDDEYINLRVKDDSLIINNEFEIDCEKMDEFPEFPELPSLKESVFAGSLSNKDIQFLTHIKPSKDDPRLYIKGIFFGKNDAVFTDGNRMAIIDDMEIDEAITHKRHKLLCPRLLADKAKMLGCKSYDVYIAADYCQMTSENLVLCAKAIKGDYPDHSPIKNSPNSYGVVKMSVDYKSLEATLKKAAIMYDGYNSVVDFTTVQRGNTVDFDLVASVDSEKGKLLPIKVETTEINGARNDLSPSFNGLYLGYAVKHFKDKTIKSYLFDDKIIFENDRYKYILMGLTK